MWNATDSATFLELGNHFIPDADIFHQIVPEHRAAFERERWNPYRYPDPDSDKPSRLLDQLTWLREIDHADVDVVYLRAGHAVVTGRVEC